MAVAGAEAYERARSDASWIRRQALKWFRGHGRTFPWRASTDPYVVLITEVLLQRTRADLVESVFERFFERFPTPKSLSEASSNEVVEILRPLGFLHRSARLSSLGTALVERHQGRVPRSKDALLALPGVGEYASNAVLTICFRQRRPLVDPNIIRLVDRLLGFQSARPRPRDDALLWDLISELLPSRGAREFNLALLDLGSVICRSRRPRCYRCPLRPRCAAFNAGRVLPAPDDARAARGS
jgi:A/G-specific adenine glycosylase